MKNDLEKFGTGVFLLNPQTNEVMIQKRDGKAPTNPYKWGLFGGLCEPDETPEECTIRELKEEINTDFNTEELILLRHYFAENIQVWRYVYYIKSNLNRNEVTLSEGEDFDWIPVDKILSYDLADIARGDMEYFVEYIRQ